MSKSKKHSGFTSFKTGSWFAGAILLFGLAVLFGLHVDQNTTISDLNFKGHSFTDEDELTSVVEAPIGVLADSVNLSDITDPAKALPFVKDARVSMNYRGVLTVNITEREPIGLIINGSDRAYVDKYGIKMPDRFGVTADVPLVYGFSTEVGADTLNGEAFEQIRDFLVEAREMPAGWHTISEVSWNEREGVVALSSENSVKLVFGNDDFKTKLENWEAFFGDVIARKGFSTFRSIDMRFRNQIVALEN